MMSQSRLDKLKEKTQSRPIPGMQKSIEQITYDKFPKDKVFSVEVFGEPDVGKTHFLATFPGMALADTENKAWIVMEKFNNEKWLKIMNFNDIRRFIMQSVANPEIQTIAIDSGSDLVDLAEAEWLSEHPRRSSVYVPGQGAFQYADVYEKIDTLVNLVKSADKYLVVSGRLKDEFAPGPRGESERTGHRIRDSYKKFPYSLALGIRLVQGITIKDQMGTKTHFKDMIFGKVIKNNFIARRVQKPYLFDVSYEGIKRELLEPYCMSYTKDCQITTCKTCPLGKLKDVVSEAKQWLKETGQYEEEVDVLEEDKKKRA